MGYSVGDRVLIIQSPLGVYGNYMVGETATISFSERFPSSSYRLEEDHMGYTWNEFCFESAEKQINPKTISKKEFLRLINGE